MPRYFRPKGGFQNQMKDSIVCLQDDGECHLVQADGAAEPHAYVGAGRVAQPIYTLTELQNLVAGGKWEEVEAPKPPETVATVEKTEAPPQAVPVGGEPVRRPGKPAKAASESDAT